jgi:class 3 adenylate cyclase/tetratricopeptide (TPR) repeat protein
VTVVFCDVVGSTALGESVDPEALRGVLARYYERMRAIVEGHGGTVEKFIGDAVMAVFGVPVVHEDDALRACRAAVEMREAFPQLRISCRIGVNTGEVVTATAESLVTGDAVNVAARLEQAAQPGEVLIAEDTLRLVRSAVEVGPERALELKGKAEPVAAYALVAVTGELERRFASPMVGRTRELRRLGDAFAQAVHDRSCQLFTVLGSAGVGKSRLAAEFLVSAEAAVFRGRCLSYGEGITYWPVVEVIKQIGSLPTDAAARPLRSLLAEIAEPASADEIAWAFRKLLEHEAGRQPVVCVLDDLHWAEETLLDLIEHVADLSRDAPILLLCMARPELLERRPSWAGGKWNATTVLLEPLDADETERLLAELGGVDGELHTRIVQIAEGNPLFLEETLALVRDSNSANVDVPPTIQALLAARLDQLDPAERAVLEHGSVEGRLFHRGAVAAMADGDGELDQRLRSLVRKELVRPDRPQFLGDDAYRFRHLLIRDAAYDALPKSVRADLHRRFAAWLDEHGHDLVELDEILGYHLEQAARYRAELGRPDPGLAVAASGRLAVAGRRARWRYDRGAARLLLQRAFDLTERPDVHLVVDLARTLSPREAATLLNDAVTRAEEDGDSAGAALAGALAESAGVYLAENTVDELERRALDALPLLEAAGDNLGLAEVWNTLANGVYNLTGRYLEGEHAAEQMVHEFRLAGRRLIYPAVLSDALLYGPRPVRDALARLEDGIGVRSSSPESALRDHPVATLVRSVMVAMDDRFEEARTLAAAALDVLRERGDVVNHSFSLAEIEMLAGDYESAEGHLLLAHDSGLARGLQTFAAAIAAARARVLCALGRYAEAEQLANEGRELSLQSDPLVQAWWRQALALVHLERGELDEAERLARDAVAVAQKTDSLAAHGDAFYDLAEVLAAQHVREAAVAALNDALESYERKGIIPLARRTRERLAATKATTP